MGETSGASGGGGGGGGASCLERASGARGRSGGASGLISVGLKMRSLETLFSSKGVVQVARRLEPLSLRRRIGVGK